MGDYAHRVITAFLGSELIPASIRIKLMRGIGFNISKDVCIWAGASFRSKNLKIGSGVFINVGFFYDGYDHFQIGNNVRIGQFVRILTATHDIGPSCQRGLIEVVGKPVTIKDGCWIGSGVTILPGVTIEHGCVVAANSVVLVTTEPNGLYAGNPARLIRDLGA
jgi:maltose O-acetyltransferase